MSSTARCLSDDFAPRLFDPGTDQLPPPPTPWNPRWAIARYYDECYLPRVTAESQSGRHPKTIEKDRQAIEEFGWICGPVPLGDFGSEHWLEFLRGIKHVHSRRCNGPRSQNTLRGIATHLKHILAEASCEEWRDAQGSRHVGLLQLGKLKVPALEVKEPEDSYTAEEIGRAIACCSAEPFGADYMPPGLSPKKFWPALICFAWNTALRPKSIFAARREWIGLKTPGWLHMPKEALKHQSRSWEFYLNAAARHAVDQAASGEIKIFAWRGWPGTRAEMFATHKQILRAAGLPESRAGFQFKGYRRAVTNWLLAHLGERPDTNVVRLVLGHRFQGALAYYGQRATIVPPLLDRFPQPTPHLPMFC